RRTSCLRWLLVLREPRRFGWNDRIVWRARIPVNLPAATDSQRSAWGQRLTCDHLVTYHDCAMDEMGPVFKALADPHRRHLLDQLHARDGQTLSELQSSLPLSRFGCMKHLRVLEDAGLISTRKVGREKLHFLNPVPIQRAYDRWVAKYARP